MPPYARIAADVNDEEEAALRAMVQPDTVDGDCSMSEACSTFAPLTAIHRNMLFCQLLPRSQARL